MSASPKKTITGEAVDVKLLKKVFKYVQPYRLVFFLSIAITITFALVSPLRPWLVNYSFDHYIVIHDKVMLLRMTLWVPEARKEELCARSI